MYHLLLCYHILYIQNKNDASNNPKNIASYYLFLLQIKKAREEQLYDSDVIRVCAKGLNLEN
jgi:hypothetical protein